MVSSDDVEPDRYKNVNTTEMYLYVDIDTSVELDTSNIDSTKKEYTLTSRYDAQYAPTNDLTAYSTIEILNHDKSEVK